MGSLYQSDYAAWSAEQASAIRDAGRQRLNAPIDWENVAEEIESLGKSERLALRSRIGTVIEHLLKLEVSPAIDPLPLWRDTVRRTREEIARGLEDSPSLRREVPEMIAKEMRVARKLVQGNLSDYGEQPRQPVDDIAYNEATVLGDWLPDRGQPTA
jgi:hypothetical protein